MGVLYHWAPQRTILEYSVPHNAILYQRGPLINNCSLVVGPTNRNSLLLGPTNIIIYYWAAHNEVLYYSVPQIQFVYYRVTDPEIL